MKKDILLLVPDIGPNFDLRLTQPLGVSYLYSNLKKHGLNCDILDLVIDNNFKNDEELIDFLAEYKIVGISIMTPNFERSKYIAKLLKFKKKDILIVAGGVHCTVAYKEVLNDLNFDVCIRGDGENIFCQIAKDYLLNCELEGVYNGTYYRKNGELICCENVNRIDNLDKLSFPKRFYNKYNSTIEVEGVKRKIYTVISSRGCPYTCSFCSIASLKIRWRSRSPENVAKEILEIYKNDPNPFILFADDNFFVKPERSIEIIKQIKKYCGCNIPFSFATRTDQVINVDLQTFRWLRSSGCQSIELGIESGVDDVLERYNKQTTAEENEKAIVLLRSSGINVIADFILFDAHTTIHELKENITFLKQNGLWGYYKPLIYNRIVAYPGTAVYDEYNERIEYFDKKSIDRIYSGLRTFRNNLQPQIDICIKEISVYLEINNENRDILSALTNFLKLLPYIFLEKIIEYYEFEEVHLLHIKRLIHNFQEELNELSKIVSNYKGVVLA
ncbi:MAG: B12-binding domain-containing radical SAM protein [Paraclostridium sp.]